MCIHFYNCLIIDNKKNIIDIDIDIDQPGGTVLADQHH